MFRVKTSRANLSIFTPCFSLDMTRKAGRSSFSGKGNSEKGKN
jgi:hypothetical protein